MHVDVVAGFLAPLPGEHLASHHVVAVEDRTDAESGRVNRSTSSVARSTRPCVASV
jgi:PDZ domain-containing secreted protein